MSVLNGSGVKAVLEWGFSERIHELRADSCSFDAAQERMQSWLDDDSFTVFNAGTYDILNINHILGLIQCRILGAMALLEIEEITTQEQRQEVHEVASSDSIRLMVTLDTNRALEDAKSRVPHKGSAPRPTLDWDTRALMLANQSIATPTTSTQRHNLIDYITRHGPDCCLKCVNGTCANEDNVKMIDRLNPDLVVVSVNSQRTVRDIELLKSQGRVVGTSVKLINEPDNEYFDAILDRSVTTTSIVERIRS